MKVSRWIILLGALGGAALLLAVFYPRQQGPVPDGANGSYANDCCGTFRLQDGRMFIEEEEKVRYSIGRDEAGPYILPATYIGAWEDRGFEMDGSRPPLKLRLDRLPRPNRIELTNGGRISYVFTRKPSRSR